MNKEEKTCRMSLFERHLTCIGCDIVEEISLAASNTSEHLRILKDARLIIGESERSRVGYSLNPATLKPLAVFLGRASAGCTPNERV
jgi:DNA-binding transcriptional ArsR family regulator